MEEKVVFKNSKGDSLVSILSIPTLNPKNAIVILCHGSGSDKNTEAHVVLEKLLKTNKYASLRFDFYGHGESEGLFENITISEAVDDVLQAIKFVKEKGYQKIVLLGGSFGGCASIIVASKTKDLSALILRSPVSAYKNLETSRLTSAELKDWKEKGYTYKSDAGENKRINYSYYEDLLRLDEYKLARKINIPTLIFHGDNDKVVPLEQSIKLNKVIKNSELLISSGGGHKWAEQRDEGKEMFKAKIMSFLDKVV